MRIVGAIDATIENGKSFKTDASTATLTGGAPIGAGVASPTGLNVEAPGGPPRQSPRMGRARRAQAASPPDARRAPPPFLRQAAATWNTLAGIPLSYEGGRYS